MKENSDDELEENDIELCLLCGEHDRLGDDYINWINCTECQEWVHESCVLSEYCFDQDDEDFACPVCLTGEK